MGTPGQCREKTRMPSRLTTVQNRQNLMTAEPRSLSLFTKKPPRKVPPPPAGTTRAATTPPAPEASAGSPQAMTRTFVEA
uniref:Uncharacterized protein n=1 Tax=Rhinopithecus roxellana TaxID=61622 RepID=A0A2K6RHB1_RHIRO